MSHRKSKIQNRMSRISEMDSLASYADHFDSGHNDVDEIQFLKKELLDLKDETEDSMQGQTFDREELDPAEEVSRMEQDMKYLHNQLTKSVSMGTMMIDKHEATVQRNQ